MEIKLRHVQSIVMLRFFVLLFSFAVVMAAQTQQESNPERRPRRSGFLMHQAAVYGNYYSTGLSDSLQTSMPTGLALNSDLALGGSATFGYLQMAQRTQVSLSYGSSYVARARYTELNALNHALNFRVDHQWSTITRFGFSANSDISTTEAFAFGPTEASLLASVEGDAADLSRAVSGQQLGDSYLAARLDGVHDSDSALRVLLFGNRVMNSSINANMAHSLSPRLTLTAGGGFVRRQPWGNNEGPTARSNFLLPHMTSGSAIVGLSYSLSPRTQIGFSIESTRGRSNLQNSYATSSSMSFQRMMGQRWFLGLSGGMGFIRMTHIQVPNTIRPSYVAGGSLGYRTNSHTFMVLYDRTISNTYGISALASQATSATWRWRTPGGQWLVAASGMRQQMTGGILPITSWRGLGEVRRNINRQLQMAVQYSYLTYSQRTAVTPLDISVNGLRVALIWNSSN